MGSLLADAGKNPVATRQPVVTGNAISQLLRLLKLPHLEPWGDECHHTGPAHRYGALP